MAISYPLDMPTNVAPRVVTMSAAYAVSISQSPFTFAQQVQQFDGDMWRASVQLPPMDRADAEQWIAFLLKLKGQRGTFRLGDNSVSGLLGSGLPDTTENLLTYSEQLDQSPWSTYTQRTAVGADAIQAPDGNTTAESFIPHATSGTHYTYHPASFTSGTTYRYSIYAKTLDGGGGGYHIALRLDDGAFPSSTYAVFDLINGTVAATTGNGASGTIEDVDDGWYRCTLIQTANATASPVAPLIYVLNSAANTDGVPDTLTYSGTTSHGVYLWGAQLNTTDSSAQYRATTSAAITNSSPRVDGASQTGSSLNLTGFLPAAVDVLKAGDLFEVDSYLYKVLNDVTADANGDVTVDIFPSLRTSPSDGTLIVTDSPTGIFRLSSSDVAAYTVDERKIYNVSFDAIEAV